MVLYGTKYSMDQVKSVEDSLSIPPENFKKPEFFIFARGMKWDTFNLFHATDLF